MKKILFMAYELGVMKFFNDPLIVNETVARSLISSDNNAGKILRAAHSPGLRDALARAVHMFNVFRKCRAVLLKQDASSNTIPIFMVPEFFFRNGNDPYTKNEFYSLIDYWKVMSRKYPNWLFVPGSVWWGDRVTAEGRQAMVVHNSVCVVNNGTLVHAYLKQLPSRLDGLLGAESGQFWDGDGTGALEPDNFTDRIRRLTAESMKRRVGPNLLKAYNDLRVRMRNSRLDSSLFTYGGLQFGIEVCLDHNLEFLKKELENRRNLDVHMVVACGMRRYPQNVMARNGGVFLRIDGHIRPLSEAIKVKGAREPQQTVLEKKGEISGFNDLIARQLAARLPGVPANVKIYDTVIL
jgi:hypothetical protein